LRVRRAGLDYHADVEGHYYSLPYQLAKAELKMRITAWAAEVFASPSEHDSQKIN
jgi:hypothetical protein